jgi:hypothetical protein
MADPSTPKNIVKQTESYDPDSGTDTPLNPKRAKKTKKNAAYAPRKSDRGRNYKKQLDDATGW